MASNNRVQVDQRTVKAAETSQKILDTFVAARSDPTAGDSAAQLAKSLGVALQQGQKMTDQWNEEEAQRGASAFATGVLEDGSKINKGELEKTASHHFMRGFNVAEGKAKALEFGMKLDQEWLNDPASQSTDPKAYNDFIQKKLSEEMAQQGNSNGDWRAGWTSAIPQVMSHMRAKQIAKVNELLTTKAIDQVSTDINSVLSMTQDPATAKQSIEESLAAANASGRLGFSQGNELARKHVIAKALETKDVRYLEAIPDKALISPEAQNSIRTAKEQVERLIRTEEAIKEAEKSKAIDAITEEAYGAVRSGKNPSEIIKKLDSLSPHRAWSLQQSLVDAQERRAERERGRYWSTLEGKRESQDTLIAYETKILDAASHPEALDKLEEIGRELAIKGVADMSTTVYNRLTNELVKHRGVNPHMMSPAYKDVESSLLENYPTSTITGRYDPKADEVALTAKAAFRKRFTERAYDFMHADPDKPLVKLPYDTLLSIAKETKKEVLEVVKPFKASQSFSTQNGKRVGSSMEDAVAALDMK